jgi:hypothetical protein
MEFALVDRGGKGGGNGSEPGWAAGLRQLYNSVLDEPLPDSFDDLLKKLDKGGKDKPLPESVDDPSKKRDRGSDGRD